MIKKVGSIESMLATAAENDEWARGRRLMTTREVDDKLNARAGYRNEIGVSQAEYARQAQLAKKMGFAAVLATEMKKNNNDSK